MTYSEYEILARGEKLPLKMKEVRLPPEEKCEEGEPLDTHIGCAPVDWSLYLLPPKRMSLKIKKIYRNHG